MLDMLAHTFNHNTWEVEASGLSEFKVSLVYRVKFRAVIHGNPVLKNNKQQQNRRKKNLLVDSFPIPTSYSFL